MKAWHLFLKKLSVLVRFNFFSIWKVAFHGFLLNSATFNGVCFLKVSYRHNRGYECSNFALYIAATFITSWFNELPPPKFLFKQTVLTLVVDSVRVTSSLTLCEVWNSVVVLTDTMRFQFRPHESHRLVGSQSFRHAWACRQSYHVSFLIE